MVSNFKKTCTRIVEDGTLSKRLPNIAAPAFSQHPSQLLPQTDREMSQDHCKYVAHVVWPHGLWHSVGGGLGGNDGGKVGGGDGGANGVVWRQHPLHAPGHIIWNCSHVIPTLFRSLQVVFVAPQILVQLVGGGGEGGGYGCTQVCWYVEYWKMWVKSLHFCNDSGGGGGEDTI